MWPLFTAVNIICFSSAGFAGVDDLPGVFDRRIGAWRWSHEVGLGRDARAVVAT